MSIFDLFMAFMLGAGLGALAVLGWLLAILASFRRQLEALRAECLEAAGEVAAGEAVHP